ncbi:MAG TPA: AMP-binding protein [Pseudonocardia sp.]|nr:AMP-binding protein [Pseudonocardia sp.]
MPHWTVPGTDERTLGKLLRRQAQERGDDLYLRFGEDRYTFGRTNELANSLAGGFARLGVRAGTAVHCYLENSADYVLISFALAKLGAVCITTNTAFKDDFLLRTFAQGDADCLVVDEGLAANVAGIWDRYRFDTVVVRPAASSPAASSPDAIPGAAAGVGSFPGAGVVDLHELYSDTTAEPATVESVTYSETATVLWTSGTTGAPKGVMQSHNLWIVSGDYMARNRDMVAEDVIYNTMPMYQSGAWIMNLYPGLIAGLPVACDPAFSVSEFWDRCRHYGATQMFTLGAMHVYLWQQPARPDDRDNPVRSGCCIPMPAAIYEPFKERFGIEYLSEGLGQSECMPYSMTDRSRHRWKPNSAGLAREGLEVKILDRDDREVPVGSPGEICVRPAEPYTIFSGYWRDPEATVRAWRNLWYHSGDLGRVDSGGEMFFVDRLADFMRYKGRNISSFEVEMVAARHPAVYEVAAHAVPADELASEDEIKIVVVLKEGAEASAEELARYINDHAPYYMVPRYIEFVTDMPHTPTGRVEKYKLRALGNSGRTWDRDAAGFLVTR